MMANYQAGQHWQKKIEDAKKATEKRCSKCGIVKPLSGFNKDRANVTWGLQSRCRECNRKAWHENKESQKPHQRNRSLIRKYGLTLEEWNKLFESQDKRCACCGTTDPGSPYGWHTDHCHDTGKVRGILCLGCNRGIGYIKTPTSLRKAAEYLERHSSADVEG